MTVTREEAAQALGDIHRASDRMVKLQGYRQGAPFFILWGLVWLVANTINAFQPDKRGIVWAVTVGVGILLSVALGVMQSRAARSPDAARPDPRVGMRFGFTVAAVLAFIGCVVWIAQPDSSKQVNAIISIVFPFVYMVAGMWVGWRLFAIGLVTAIGILAGYAWIHDYFELWMGAFAGGSLIAGGVWLRTA